MSSSSHQPEDGAVWRSDRRCHDAASDVTQRDVLGCSGGPGGSHGGRYLPDAHRAFRETGPSQPKPIGLVMRSW